MLCILLAGALCAGAAGYNGVYPTVNMSYDKDANAIILVVTRADVLDGASHLVEGELSIAFDVYRGVGHDSGNKIGSTTAVKFVGGIPQSEVKYVDKNLPDPGEGNSMLINYSVRAKIGTYTSDLFPVAQYNIDKEKRPMPVSNLKGTVAADKSSVTVSFNCPTHFTNGNEMSSTSINNIVVEKYNEQTYSWVSKKKFLSGKCKPGTELIYEDTDIAGQNQVSYRVTVFSKNGTVTIEGPGGVGTQEVDKIMRSEEKTLTVWLGAEGPTDVRSLKASYDKGSITLSWTPSSTGDHGGNIDVKTLKYRINRQVEGGNYETVVDNYTQTSYVDSKICAHTASYTYTVVAMNEHGSTIGTSTSIYCGEPYALPFVESAKAKTTMDNTGWVANTIKGNGSGGWCAAEYLQDTKNEKKILAADHNGLITNLLYYQQTALGRFDYLLSAPILTGGNSNFYLSMDYYSMSGYDNVLSVELTDAAGDYVEVGRIQFDTITVNGWCSVKWMVENLEAGATTRLRLVSEKGGKSNSVAVDNIRLEAEMPDGIQQTQTPCVKNGIRYNLLGQPVDRNYRGIVIVDGEKMVNW